MIQGLDIFRNFFLGYEHHYTVIGGVACHLNMEDAGIDFRATKDFDIVLVAEALNADFVRQFWAFVSAGGYQLQEKSSGEKQFYRFSKPRLANYPAMLELFSRQLDNVVLVGDATLTPVPMDEDLSSLSAILLDDNYYRCIQDGRVSIEGIAVLSAEYIIPFKMRAYHDLRSRREQLGTVDARQINKHKNDVFRIAQLLSPDQRVVLPEEIKYHMREFIEAMEEEAIDLKNLNMKGVTVERILSLVQQVYDL